MVWDILRFNALALKLIADEEGTANAKGDQHAEEDSDDETVVEGEELSIGDFIKREGLSDAFRDDYLLVGRERSFLRSIPAKSENKSLLVLLCHLICHSP
jgi:hypothetical protein